MLAAIAASIGITTVLAADNGRTRDRASAGEATERQLWQARSQIEHSGERRIGPDFACAVVLDRKRLRIFVTSEVALARADAIRQRLAVADDTDLAVVSPRFQRSTMLAMRQAVEASIPAGGRGSSSEIAFAYPNGPRCPQLKVGLRGGKGVWRGWRRQVVAKYGADRLRIYRAARVSKDTVDIPAEALP